MDISGLTSAASGFTGFRGTSSLPAGVQARLMTQSDALNLLPSASTSGLGVNLDIYAAVSQQALGAMSGRSAIELSRIILAGRETDPASSRGDTPGSAGGSDDTAQLGDSEPAASGGHKNPPIGSTLDAILKEDGFVPKENPYEFRKDFFADRNGPGGLLDYLG